MNDHPSTEVNHIREGIDGDGDIIWSETPIMCGDSAPGHGPVFCEEHEAEMVKRYPQGWSYYPGDICPHGMYTGGSGIDWMCGPCEMGEVEPFMMRRYRMFWTLGDSAPMDMNCQMYAWDEQPADFDAFWQRITARIKTTFGNTDLPIDEWDVSTHIVADSYTEWRVPA